MLQKTVEFITVALFILSDISSDWIFIVYFIWDDINTETGSIFCLLYLHLMGELPGIKEILLALL